MPSNQRSKRKSKSIEPITFDELRDAAGMSGFVSFLNLPPDEKTSTPVDTADAVTHPIDIETTPVDIAAAIEIPADISLAAVDMTGVDSKTSTSMAEFSGTAEARSVTAAVEATPVDRTPHFVTPVVLPRPGTGQILYAPVKGGKNLYRCSTVQEGHSHLEEALYQLLWRTATVVSADVRLSQVSQSDLARHLRITDKNLRIALERLVEKRSLEVAAAPDFALKIARRYRVFSYSAIIERRRAAGLEWVIRNKGVQFVSAEDVERYRLAGSTPIDIETTRVDMERIR